MTIAGQEDTVDKKLNRINEIIIEKYDFKDLIATIKSKKLIIIIFLKK